MKCFYLCFVLLFISIPFSLMATKDAPTKTCSYFWDGFGRNHISTPKHGSKYYYKCKTCAGENGYSGCSICPWCLPHHVGHYLTTTESTGGYFCDCGAGGLEKQKTPCPHNPKLTINKENSTATQTEGLDLDRLLDVLHDTATKDKPFVLSTVGLETIFNAVNSIRTRTHFTPILKENLKVESFYFGRSEPVQGILTAGSVEELNKMIEQRTGFQNVLQGRVEEAVVTTSISIEEFIDPFDKDQTRNDFEFHADEKSVKKITMMCDYERTNVRHLQNDDFIAAQIPYRSGGHLVLIMNKNQNILSSSTEDITNTLTELFDKEKEEEGIRLFVPKAQWKTEPQSIKEVVLKHFPEKSDLIKQFDDFFQGAKFEIDEIGTKAAGVTGFVSKGGIDSELLIFDHPFIAIIMDPNNKPLFISYITF